MTVGETVDELFDLPAGRVLCTSEQYLVAFCRRWRAASDNVISGLVVHAKYGDSG